MLKTFIIQFILTFILIVVSALLITISKRRQANSRHQLTGMCHKTGGTVCSSCQDIKKKG